MPKIDETASRATRAAPAPLRALLFLLLPLPVPSLSPPLSPRFTPTTSWSGRGPALARRTRWGRRGSRYRARHGATRPDKRAPGDCGVEWTGCTAARRHLGGDREQLSLVAQLSAHGQRPGGVPSDQEARGGVQGDGSRLRGGGAPPPLTASAAPACVCAAHSSTCLPPLRLGIPDSHIVLMLAETMACNPRNVRRGEVGTATGAAPPNLYAPDTQASACLLACLLVAGWVGGWVCGLCVPKRHGSAPPQAAGGRVAAASPTHSTRTHTHTHAQVDYSGREVSVESVLRVLTGSHPHGTPASQRLGSGANSSVLLFLTGGWVGGWVDFGWVAGWARARGHGHTHARTRARTHAHHAGTHATHPLAHRPRRRRVPKVSRPERAAGRGRGGRAAHDARAAPLWPAPHRRRHLPGLHAVARRARAGRAGHREQQAG